MGSLPLFNPESRHKFFFHQFANPAIEIPMAHLRDVRHLDMMKNPVFQFGGVTMSDVGAVC